MAASYLRPNVVGQGMRIVAVVLLVTLGCHGDPVKCDKACRNYAQLVFWKQADAEIAAAPPTERDELRKQKLTKISADIEQSIQYCVSRCVSANYDRDVDCLIEAKTAERAQACTKE
jgi:hypothetical protein